MNKLIEEIADLELLLQVKKAALYSKMAQCQHEWGEVEAAHIYHPGYRVFPTRKMQVLRGDPLYISPKKEERWRRKCLICGKEEFTRSAETKVVTKRVPIF
jgi:hypothetical protein